MVSLFQKSNQGQGAHNMLVSTRSVRRIVALLRWRRRFRSHGMPFANGKRRSQDGLKYLETCSPSGMIQASMMTSYLVDLATCKCIHFPHPTPRLTFNCESLFLGTYWYVTSCCGQDSSLPIRLFEPDTDIHYPWRVLSEHPTDRPSSRLLNSLGCY